MSGSASPGSWELSDGVVTIRPPRISERDALTAGRDAESEKWFGVSDQPPSPTSCVIVNGGVVGWVDYDREQEWLQPRDVNVGYSIFEAHRRRGYATRAVRLFLQHLADSTDARQAYLAIDAENAGSLGVARALGAAETDRYQNDKGRLQVRFVLPIVRADSRKG